MKKVIGFSIFGDAPRYTVGAIRNADIAKEVYPDFECWVYVHRDTVPGHIVEELNKRDNVRVIMRDGDLGSCKPTTWRFEPIDDPEVEVVLSRDTDTRILGREVMAVREWLDSGKTFHIMRDHPHHDFLILAGMFGSRKIADFSWKENLDKLVQTEPRYYDQNFLKDVIYPLVRNDCVIHASFFKINDNLEEKIYGSLKFEGSGPDVRDFPIDYCDELKFVGEYVYENESRSQFHIDELRRAL